MLWWSRNNSDGFPWLTRLSKFCGFLGNILFRGYFFFFFWSEHCSTTQPVLLLRLETLFPFISPWPMRQSSNGSPLSWRLRMCVRSLMMVNLVFHCISFHSNQLRTADLQKKKKIGRAGFNLRENVKTSSTPQFSSSDQLLSHVQIFVTQWTAACQASLSITNSLSEISKLQKKK